MKYAEEFVKRVVDTVLERRCSARQAERLLGVPRRTVGRWLKRRLGQLPYWFSSCEESAQPHAAERAR